MLLKNKQCTYTKTFWVVYVSSKSLATLELVAGEDKKGRSGENESSLMLSVSEGTLEPTLVPVARRTHARRSVE